MNRDKSSLPKSRTWWCHHFPARDISQTENKAIITVWYRYTFRHQQLSAQKAVNNGGDNHDAMSVNYYLALCTDPKEG